MKLRTTNMSDADARDEEPFFRDTRHTLLALLFVASLSLIGIYYHRREPSHHTVASVRTTTRGVPGATDTEGVITLGTDGRLGDQIGGYAVLYALAKLQGRKAYVHPTMHERLTPLFRITLPVLPEHMTNVSWKIYGFGNSMSERYYHLEGKYVEIVGYFHAWTFFHHLRGELLEQFTFHKKVKEQAWSSLSKLRDGRRDPTFVGVHVRRGDYVRKMRDDFMGVVADRAFLANATEYFRTRYQEAIFVVVSDDMPWCRKSIDASRGDVYFAGQGVQDSPESDFALLAHCNHTIITIGNFGFWAAYLAGGEVVYLANYTLPDSRLLRWFTAPSRYLPWWIGIQADLTAARSASTRPPSFVSDLWLIWKIVLPCGFVLRVITVGK